ncbi:hypothetical protein POL25_04470 [Nannocystis sp. bb15-2]|uniref:Uncharacterized protein n=1 Tax=Nannocystis bainbridge TaxID=2995303 RepID=A0ABT5DSI3_9BACT|nr:hypothetical protein [Nannocystis bainbridge]
MISSPTSSHSAASGRGRLRIRVVARQGPQSHDIAEDDGLVCSYNEALELKALKFDSNRLSRRTDKRGELSLAQTHAPLLPSPVLISHIEQHRGETSADTAVQYREGTTQGGIPMRDGLLHQRSFNARMFVEKQPEAGASERRRPNRSDHDSVILPNRRLPETAFAYDVARAADINCDHSMRARTSADCDAPRVDEVDVLGGIARRVNAAPSRVLAGNRGFDKHREARRRQHPDREPPKKVVDGSDVHAPVSTCRQSVRSTRRARARRPRQSTRAEVPVDQRREFTRYQTDPGAAHKLRVSRQLVAVRLE